MSTVQTFGIGKPTRRGIRKCEKCGVHNGTKSIFCKNKDCDMMFKDYTEKKKSISDAVQLITLNMRKLYSVRIAEHCTDQRGFVQLPLNHSLNINNKRFNEVALCFVDNCPRLLQNSFSTSIHSCQHIIASGKSHTIASALPIKLHSILKLKVPKEIQEKLWILVNDTDIPLVQKVSKTVMAIRCQVTPKHPLGYLHLTFSGDMNDKRCDKYICDCSKTSHSYKCIHYYLCICALASDPKYAQEFKSFINFELEKDETTNIASPKLDHDCGTLVSAKVNQNACVETVINSTRSKKKKLQGARNPIVHRKIWPKIYPIQINIMNNSKESHQDDNNPTWSFDNWLSFVVESMNKLITFENAGIMNTLVYNIPWDFYKTFRKRIPSMYISQGQEMLNYELLHIMNIGHVKEIFWNSKVKLKVSKRFILSDNSVYREIDENEELSDEMMPHFIYFLNVGQLTVDDSDNTNNSFVIEWMQTFERIGVGQLKLQFKYGRKCL
ncbi:uncharacterized protein C2orf42 homolog [Coccinella septempunctata]|uniref:uncharacterized protein C2orf42 homolog n=1 Tax=Coccinella septempunctata TaxID=41139 RepID=UPI001D07568E|nr:uncharacterized protein C2orf42 homolog [Coccinella septempunctata]